MTLLVHHARLLDGDGSTDGWVRLDGSLVVARGSGEPAAAQDDEVVDAAGATLVPGFVDLHTHGGGGAAYGDGVDAAATAIATQGAHGTSALVASLVSRPVDVLAAQLHELADVRRRTPALLGAHLEGPFLAPARRGAHSPEALVDPTPEAVDTLLEAAEGSLVQITVAPERPGGLDAVRRLTDAGVVVAVGHTEATYEQARAAFDAGASLLTHAFNAMPGIHHRLPGPVLAAVDDGRAVLEVIADGHHVAGPAIRLLLSAAPGRVALVTDAMAAAGAGDGAYLLGELEVTVRDGAAYLADGVTLAGSTLTMDAAVARLVGLGVPLRDAVDAATVTPARVVGRQDTLGHLRVGATGGALLLDDAGRLVRVL
ncbi:MAG: N-acetylglucosamine-6-phosphate deacetylase [Nocardioidaceae bacterium]